MAKAEISWRRVTQEGQTLQCYAQHVGNRWIFYRRQKRFDRWIEVKQPPVEDWLALLDSVRRRINRRLLRPEEEGRLCKTIAEKFPGAETKAAEDQDQNEDEVDCHT